MTAEEIREECTKNSEKLGNGIEFKSSIQLLQYVALMEIAAQLAELKEALGDLTYEPEHSGRAIRTVEVDREGYVR